MTHPSTEKKTDNIQSMVAKEKIETIIYLKSASNAMKVSKRQTLSNKIADLPVNYSKVWYHYYDDYYNLINYILNCRVFTISNKFNHISNNLHFHKYQHKAILGPHSFLGV